jgi:hypothetical protein
MDDHVQVFAKYKINGRRLKLMDDGSLRLMGISLSVHRADLLDLIGELFEQGWFMQSC